MTSGEIYAKLNNPMCKTSLDAYRIGERDGYHKAIDDFVKFCNEMPVYENESGELMPMPVEMMAKYLLEKKEFLND